jgi:hypothetical protein
VAFCCFRVRQSLKNGLLNSKDQVTTLFRSVVDYSPTSTVSQSRRRECSATLLWKLKILLMWSYWQSLPAVPLIYVMIKLKPQCLFTLSRNFVRIKLNIIHSIHFFFYVYCPTNVHFYSLLIVKCSPKFK